MQLGRAQGVQRELDRERAAMLAVLALALAGCGLGLLAPPHAAPHQTVAQALDLVRILCTVALALSLLLGPGVAWRALRSADRPLSLGFLPLPGLALIEVLAMAMVPTVATRHEFISASFRLTDAVAVATMLGFGAALAVLVWKTAPPPSVLVSDR